ncbi:hypothetical protein NBRC116494_21510 [Aurantivibrio plasticivorans]
MNHSNVNYYSHSSDFPESAIQRIPDGLVAAVDKGNSDFFSPLQIDFPNMYKALCDTNRVQLQELVVNRETLLGEAVTDYIYSWSVTLEGELQLIFNIPRFDLNSPVRKKSLLKYLPSLPPCMACFYQHMDGGKISEGIEFSGFDLPNGVSDWVSIHEYYMSSDLDSGDALLLLDDLNGSDVRVVSTLRNGDFIVCQLGGIKRQLYWVALENPTSAIAIPNPEVSFDRYYACCVQEAPIDFPL